MQHEPYAQHSVLSVADTADWESYAIPGKAGACLACRARSISWCRLARIRVASGSEAAERLLKEILGKADFDLEEYDKAMAAAFDDEYYGVRAASSERPAWHSPGLCLSRA